MSLYLLKVDVAVQKREVCKGAAENHNSSDNKNASLSFDEDEVLEVHRCSVYACVFSHMNMNTYADDPFMRAL